MKKTRAVYQNLVVDCRPNPQLAICSLGTATGLLPFPAALSRLYAATVPIAAGLYGAVAAGRQSGFALRHS